MSAAIGPARLGSAASDEQAAENGGTKAENRISQKRVETRRLPLAFCLFR